MSWANPDSPRGLGRIPKRRAHRDPGLLNDLPAAVGLAASNAVGLLRLAADGTVRVELGNDGVQQGDHVSFVWRFDDNTGDVDPDPQSGEYPVDLDGVDLVVGVFDPTTSDRIRNYTCDSFAVATANDVPDDIYVAVAEAEFGEFCIDDLGNSTLSVVLLLSDSSASKKA